MCAIAWKTWTLTIISVQRRSKFKTVKEFLKSNSLLIYLHTSSGGRLVTNNIIFFRPVNVTADSQCIFDKAYKSLLYVKYVQQSLCNRRYSNQRIGEVKCHCLNASINRINEYRKSYQ